MAEKFLVKRNTRKYASLVVFSRNTNRSVGIFPLYFLSYFLVFLFISLSFPAASRCENSSKPNLPQSEDENNELVNWAKGHSAYTTHRHRQIRHLHYNDEHNIPKRQSRRHGDQVAVGEDKEKDEKRLTILLKSNNSAENEDDGFQHPKQALLLPKQLSSLSQNLAGDNVLQSVRLTDDTENENFSDGYWVRIAQAKVLALAVENGTLPRLDEYSEIMKPASCRKDHDMECNEFTAKCAEEKATRILSQLELQHKQSTRENVTLYMSIIVKDCGINMYKNSDYFDESSSLERASWNLDSPPANTPQPLPVFHCNSHMGQDNVLTHFRLTYMSSEDGGDGKLIKSLPETLANDLVPRYFVIEISNGGGRWSLSPKSVQPFWLLRFSAKADYSYQLRVTAVSSRYVYPPVVSPVVAIYKSSDLTINNPKNLRVVNVTVDKGAARPKPSALLRWESGSGHNASCDYDVHYMDDNDYTSTERKKGDDAFWVKLDKLNFQKNYSIKVIEKFGGGKEANVNTILHIPSCLEMLHFSFDYCLPPPPFKVRMENVTDDSFWVAWNPPKYANNTNRIKHYNVTVDWIYTPSTIATTSPYPIATDGSHGDSHLYASSASMVSASQIHHFPNHVPSAPPYNQHRIFSEIILGNVTSVQIKNTTHLKGRLKISVAAFGSVGSSPPAWEYFTYKGLYAETSISPSRTSISESWSLGNILTFALALCGVIGLVILFCFLKHMHDKRQRQKKRQQKFENYEKESLELQHFGERDATKWEIDCCNLDLREGIGKGNFGLVRRAFLNHKGKKMIVAVKTLRDGVNSKEVDKLWEEYDILRNLDPHVHIVGLKGIVTKHVPIPLLVVEYCDGGDLQSHLRKAAQSAGFSGPRRYSPAAVSASVSSSTLSAGSSCSSIAHPVSATTNTTPSVRVVTNAAYFMKSDVDSLSVHPPLTISDMLSYSRQVAVGMEYLSSNKIVHRDLAARNILVSGKSRILKISDFGLSKDVYEQNWYKRNSTGDVPIKWLAVECILNEFYTTKSDVWSYGILLWEIFTYGGNPYPGVPNTDVFGLLKNGCRLPRPDTCPLDLYELMRFCWDDEPNARPDFTGIRLILEDVIERVTHVTYLNLESSSKVRSSTAEGRGGICAAAASAYKNCDSGFDEYDESPTFNEPVLPPRNRKTFD